MGIKVYKTYELEEALDLYTNKNGISTNMNDINEFEPSIEFAEDEENIDIQIEKDFLEDVAEIENESIEQRIIRIKRYQKIVKMLKKKYNYKCQLCGYSFHMDNGKDYCEAHHIEMLSEGGSQSPENVIILCANHHRIFHYACDTIIVGKLINGKIVIKIGEEEFIVQF
jgi:5-methylcytosine-specific restriction protein A